MKLETIVGLDELKAAIADGYVREREHPDDPTLTILNYAEKAQYERVWTNVTRNCRGLIVRDGEVLARPWPKFFNVGEHEDGALDLAASVQVSDKADGSLGILYPGPDGLPAIATRGSFQSEQAEHATALYRDRYLGAWTPLPTYTYLFEIVYPGNRIVLDYGDLDDLILLGAVDIESGITRGPDFDPGWPGRRAQVFDAPTLADALRLSPRPNAEGLVVRYEATGLMVKIKQDDYVRLHKIVTGLSERGVWEHLSQHENLDSLAATVPDEFHGWLRDVGGRLLEQHEDVSAAAHADYHRILGALPDDFERKEFALAAAESPHRGLLFQLLDGRDIAPAIWKGLRPVGFSPMRLITEDVA